MSYRHLFLTSRFGWSVKLWRDGEVSIGCVAFSPRQWAKVVAAVDAVRSGVEHVRIRFGQHQHSYTIDRKGMTRSLGRTYRRIAVKEESREVRFSEIDRIQKTLDKLKAKTK
jgi:hypothetical protein